MCVFIPILKPEQHYNILLFMKDSTFFYVHTYPDQPFFLWINLGYMLALSQQGII